MVKSKVRHVIDRNYIWRKAETCCADYWLSNDGREGGINIAEVLGKYQPGVEIAFINRK